VKARGATLAVSIVLLATVVAGCDSTAAPPAAPTVTSSAPGAASAGCDRPAAGTADAKADLAPGPTNGLPPSPTVGQPLVIEAVILDHTCGPATGAGVRLWHTDAAGLYAPASVGGCCYYEGTVLTDQTGRFRLRTIRPAEYPIPSAPPAHIHLEIRHPAGNLDTMIIFGAAPSTGPIAPTGNELVVALRRDTAGWRGTAEFLLPTPK
jgi:protocatechuate 3,4-dioxygenase beta subunit